MIETELGDFLRSRRGRLSPKAVGVEPHGDARRVTGLKREEVARLAGVSVDYYARLEQGRRVRFSPAVLTAVGRALRLDEVDQAHLVDLATVHDRRRTAGPPEARQDLRAYERIMRALQDKPAFVSDWRHNVLLANPLALALYLDMGSDDAHQRNFASFIFTHPGARDLFVDWGITAALTAGSLRRSLARHPDDPELLDLIARCRRLADFDELWSRYELAELTHNRLLYRHPVAGELWVECDNLSLVGDEDLLLTVGNVDPGSPSEAALRRLAGPGRLLTV